MGTVGGYCRGYCVLYGAIYKSNNVGGIGIMLKVKIGPYGGLTTWGTTTMGVQKYV